MSCSAMSSRSKAYKVGDTSSKHGDTTVIDSVDKWCKAVWYMKGKSGKTETEVIPRSWISKSRKTVTWPPKHVNFKSAIQECMRPMKSADCSTFILVSCTESVNSLDEAQQLETEAQGSSGSDDQDTDNDSDTSNQQGIDNLGRGQRSRKKSTFLEGYDTAYKPEDGSTEACGNEEDGEQQQEADTVARVLDPGLGNTSSSASQLEMVASQLSSTITTRHQLNGSEKERRKSAVITASMRKAMSSKLPFRSVQEDDTISRSENTPEVEGEPPATVTMDIQKAKNTLSSTSTGTQVDEFLVKFVAESKVRHGEVIEKIDNLERKVNTVLKALKRVGSENSSLSLLDTTDTEILSSAEDDVKFCVDLPVHTFEDFHKLEDELEASSAKRKALVSIY